MLGSLKNLLKDTMTYGFAGVLSQVIGFLLLPLYTRYLGPEDYGAVAMLAFIGVFFVPLAGLGLSNAVFRRYNLHHDEKKQNAVLSTALIFVLVSSALLFLIVYQFKGHLAVILVSDNQLSGLVVISLITGIFMSINSLLNVVLRAKRKVKTIAVIRVIQLIVTITLTVYLVVYLEWGVKGVLVGTMFGSILTTLIQGLISLPKLSFDFSIAELNKLLKYGLPFLPHRLFGFGLGFVGLFLIKSFLGLAEAGLYNVAMKFAIPLSFIVGAVQSAWVPLKFQIHREEKLPAVIFKNIISLYVVVIGIVLVILSFIGPELIRLVTPLEYHESVYFFPLILLIHFAQGNYYMISTGFEITDDTRPLPIVSGVGLLVLLIIGWLSVEEFQIYGIVISLVLSWTTMTVLIRSFAVSRFYVPLNARILLISVLIVISTVALSSFVQNYSVLVRFMFQGVFSVSSCLIFLYLLLFNIDFRDLELTKYPFFAFFRKFNINTN